MKKLYFIRHGLSQANIDRVWGGHTDSLLVDDGRIQAAKAADTLIEQDININLIVASPLLRTQETARIIAERTGYPVEQIVTDNLLIERHFGVLDGKVAASFFEKNTYQDMDHVKNAETIEDLQKRAALVLKMVSARPEDTILLVGHGAFGRAIRRVALHRPYTDEYAKDWERWQIGNAEIIQLA